MQEAKVLVLIPTNHDKIYCFAKFIKNLKSINLTNADILFADDTATSDEHMKEIQKQGFEVIKVTKTVDAIKRGEKLHIVQCLANTRDALRQEFIKRKEYTHAVWFDSDIIMPKETIPSLLRHNKDLVSGIYFQKKRRILGKEQYDDFYPVAFRYLEPEGVELGITKYGAELTVQDIFPSRLIGEAKEDFKIVAIGTGCFMASRKLMEDDRWQFRFNPDKPDTTEDMWFCLDIIDLGYEIFVDSEVCCRHHMEKWRHRIKDKTNQE